MFAALAKRNVEQEIDELIRDNFRNFSLEQQNKLRPACMNGLSLREELARAKAELKSNPKRAAAMGNNYDQRLRDVYVDEGSPLRRLRPMNMDEAIAAGLSNAIVDMNRHINKYEPIMTWMSQDHNVNQLSMVLLLQNAHRHPQCICNRMSWH